MAILRFLLLLYIIAILLVVVLSWFPQQAGSPANQAFVALRRITDPVLEPIRRVLPRGVIDLSPMIVLFVLMAIYGALS